MIESAIKHQNGGRRCVFGKYVKHRLLIFVLEMKEAVPGQDAPKSPPQFQCPHIADDPLLIRHPRSAQRYECRRAVHAGNAKALRNHVKRNGGTTPAAKIEDSRTPWNEAQEALDKGLIDPARSATVGIPRQCMTLVMGDDPVCCVFHRICPGDARVFNDLALRLFPI
jgi:hypothetical protein